MGSTLTASSFAPFARWPVERGEARASFASPTSQLFATVLSLDLLSLVLSLLDKPHVEDWAWIGRVGVDRVDRRPNQTPPETAASPLNENYMSFVLAQLT